MQLLASTAGDVAKYALAVFLVVTGFTLAYVFVRLGGTFARLSSFIKGTEHELLPVIHKVGETVDGVNGQLTKVDQVTDSAVDMADSVRKGSAVAKKKAKTAMAAASAPISGRASMVLTNDFFGRGGSPVVGGGDCVVTVLLMSGLQGSGAGARGAAVAAPRAEVTSGCPPGRREG